MSSEKASHLMWSSRWPWEVEMRPEAQKGWGWDPDPLTSWPCWHSTWVSKEKSSSGAWKCRNERFLQVFKSVCVLLMPRWCSRDQVCPLHWHNQKSRWNTCHSGFRYWALAAHDSDPQEGGEWAEFPERPGFCPGEHFQAAMLNGQILVVFQIEEVQVGV